MQSISMGVSLFGGTPREKNADQRQLYPASQHATPRPVGALPPEERKHRMESWLRELCSGEFGQTIDGSKGPMFAMREIAKAAKVMTHRAELNRLFDDTPLAMLHLMALVTSEHSYNGAYALLAVYNLLWPNSPNESARKVCGNFLLLDKNVESRRQAWFGKLPPQVMYEFLEGLCKLLDFNEKVARFCGEEDASAYGSESQEIMFSGLAAGVLRYLLCAPLPVWEHVVPLVSTGLLQGFARLLGSENPKLFGEGALAATFLMQVNAPVIDRWCRGAGQEPGPWVGLVRALVKALKHWGQVPPGKGGPTDAGPLWDLAVFLAKRPRGRYYLLAENAGAPLREDPGMWREDRGEWMSDLNYTQTCQELLYLFTEAMHTPAVRARAFTFWTTIVVDAPGLPGTCIEGTLRLHPDPGLLLLSLTLGLSEVARAGRAPLAWAGSASDADPQTEHTGREALRLLTGGAAQSAQLLKRWIIAKDTVAKNGRCDEHTWGVTQAVLGGLVVTIHDFAKMLAVEPGGVPAAAPGHDPFRDGTMWALRHCLDVVAMFLDTDWEHVVLALEDNLYELLNGMALLCWCQDTYLVRAAADIVGLVSPSAFTEEFCATAPARQLAERLLAGLLPHISDVAANHTVRAAWNAGAAYGGNDGAPTDRALVMASATRAVHALFQGEPGAVLLVKVMQGKDAPGEQRMYNWLERLMEVRDDTPEHTEHRHSAMEHVATGLVQALPHAVAAPDLPTTDRGLSLLVRCVVHGDPFGMKRLISDAVPGRVNGRRVTVLLERCTVLLDPSSYSKDPAFNPTAHFNATHQGAVMRAAAILVHRFATHNFASYFMDNMSSSSKVALLGHLARVSNRFVDHTSDDADALDERPTSLLAAQTLTHLTQHCDDKTWLQLAGQITAEQFQ